MADVSSSSSTVPQLPLDAPLEVLNLNVWAFNPLMRNGIDTLGKLIELSEQALLDILSSSRNARRIFDEIVDTLTQLGYGLAS